MPKGNKNSSTQKRMWTNTIRRAVAQGDAETLRKIADKLIDMALDGDLGAIREIGDRLEGKPTQTIANDEDKPFTIDIIRRVIVDGSS